MSIKLTREQRQVVEHSADPLRFVDPEQISRGLCSHGSSHDGCDIVSESVEAAFLGALHGEVANFTILHRVYLADDSSRGVDSLSANPLYKSVRPKERVFWKLPTRCFETGHHWPNQKYVESNT